MTQYLDKSFSVALGNDNFRSGWDAIFGKKPSRKEAPDYLEMVKSRLHMGDKVRLSGAPCEVRGRDSFPNGEAYREYLVDLAKDLILVAKSSFEEDQG